MNLTKETRIGVLLGGLSKEREISLRTGKGMALALRSRGYANVFELDVGRDISDVLQAQQIEVAVLALHGRFGEDGTIQGLLEYMRIPYTGSGVLGSAVGMNKLLSKVLFDTHRIPTPPYLEANRETDLKKLKSWVKKKIRFPAIAKPVCEGSTLGLTVVRFEKEIEEAQRQALQFDGTVLWERYIQGKELTVGFLGGKALPVVEIVPKKGLFDYEAKYTKGMTDYFCPARISKAVTQKVQAVATRAFQVTYAESFGRVDLILSKTGKPWVLEINTIPGMTETSLLPKAAKAAGINYEEAVETILKEARLKA